ncbi:MAG: hypothetical protein WB492_02500 [Christiangramia sp.]
MHLSEIAKKAGITKKLSMHIARHSFGNIAGDKIPIQMLLYKTLPQCPQIGSLL